MDDAVRLRRLLERLSDPGPKLPAVSAADAAAIAGALHDEIDEATAGRAAEAAEQGLRIACAPGCNACCANLIVTFEAEAMAVATWLEAPENRETRDAFLAAYPAWRRSVGNRPAEIARARRDGDDSAADRLMLEVWEQRIMCAFNRDGACTIYPVRPTVCRVTHALDTADHCSAEGAQVQAPSSHPFVPLERLVARSRPARFAMHAALGGDSIGSTPLCDAVDRLLERSSRTGSLEPVTRRGATPMTAVKIGRNAPCPCGSGVKYKRCCGR